MQHAFDVVIIGGGMVGLSLARALAGSQLTVALVESQSPAPIPPADQWDTRVYAVSPGCASFLERCGAWGRLPEGRVTRVEGMRVYGDDATARIEFSAYDAGLRELAFIVEGGQLQHALWDGVREAGIRVFCPAAWTELEIRKDDAHLRLEDGAELSARLIVGADGPDSRIRGAAGIAVAPADYGQLGVVANFSCEKPHQGIAYQWFMRDGVLALLPLPGARVSMVWSVARERAQALLALPAEALALEVAAASRNTLGALQILTRANAFPLKLARVTQFAKPRLALVGDAAHNVHPLAGQGMNLGLRDARALADVMTQRGPQRDCGDYALLRRYERARKEDVLGVQLVTDGLQKLFNNDAVLLTGLRNLGLRLVNAQPQIKNLLLRQAVA